MSRESKLKIYDHEAEAKQLRDDGKGWIEISNILNKKYPDEGGYSHMAVKRGIVGYEI